VTGDEAMRIKATLAALFCYFSLSGCGADLLWWPGFNPIGASYVNTIPVQSIATEVQCEIFDFIQNENPKPGKEPSSLLDPTKGATVSLTLQTDLTGSVQYVGVNLAKIGFADLATVITATNAVPTLQAKGTGHSTLSAEVDFVVAQSNQQQIVASKPPASTLIKQSDMKTPYQMASFEQIAGTNPPVFNPVPQPVAKPIPPYFPTANCKNRNLVARAYLQLWLKEWLDKFKKSEETNLDFVCNTKVTLHSTFQIAVDVSAGVNPLLVSPIILPVSGINLDANPAYQHSLQISFALKDPNERHATYCSGLQGSQPAQINSRP
jgi:hypothetical protein